MEEVIKIFKELQESSGKRLQEILEEHKDNELLKKFYGLFITLIL